MPGFKSRPNLRECSSVEMGVWLTKVPMNRRIPILSLRVLVGAALATALVGCGDNGDQDVVGTLEWDRIELVAEALEPITDIQVKVGDYVKAGDIIMKLDTSRQRALLAQMKAQQREAAARLKELRLGPRSERIANARARLSGAESQLDNRRNDYQRGEMLHNEKLISDQELDRLKTARDAAQAQYDEIKATLDELVAGTRKEELEQARQALAAANAQVKSAAVTLKRLTVRAPVDGRIDALPFKKGEYPAQGATIAVMLGGAAPYARIYVPETIRAQVHAGTKADVAVDGIDAPFPGRVRSIASEAAFTPYYSLTERDRSRLVYLTEVELTSPEATKLAAGLPVTVTLNLDDDSGGN